jgi:hypothetical protein
MPHQNFSNGLYLAKRPVLKFGGVITHYGVIEIGNIMKLVDADPRFPVVYHQTADKGFTVEYLNEDWEIIGLLDKNYSAHKPLLRCQLKFTSLNIVNSCIDS